MQMEAEDFASKMGDLGYINFFIRNSKVMGLPPKIVVFKCALILKKTHPFLIVILYNREVTY